MADSPSRTVGAPVAAPQPEPTPGLVGPIATNTSSSYLPSSSSSSSGSGPFATQTTTQVVFVSPSASSSSSGGAIGTSGASGGVSTTATLVVALPTSELPLLTQGLTATLLHTLPRPTDVGYVAGPNEGPSPTKGDIDHPTHDQTQIIWVAVVMLLSIAVGWNMVLLRSVLYPWKMLVNLIHELFHALMGILTGADLYSLCIDPDKGPISGMTGGVPLAVLAAGYLGSILVGSTLILFAFDVTMSKIAWLSIVPLFTICFWFGRTWARVRIIVAVGISISFWFIDHAMAMRYYILFLGVMCAFYVVWDAMDDLIFRKENESDAALFARLSPPSIHAWVMIWLLITLAFVSLAMLGGLHFFNKTLETQRNDQIHFLPT